ncbi:deoxyribonuclease V [Pseudomonas sp. Marseille-QA0892]
MSGALPFEGWDGSVAGARALQLELAQRVSLEDDFPELRIIAGVDVGFEEGGTITRASAVLMDFATLQPLAERVARVPTSMPYIPGLLSFRELPALLDALNGLPEVPDLVFVDGQGIAHPRRLGIGAHLGVVTGLPTVGVAKTILTGKHEPVPEARGSHVPLMDKGEIIGGVLRSRERVRPLIVSPGHRVSIDTAVQLVMRCVTRYRLPEPTRLADRLASRRDRHRTVPDQPTLL